MQQKTANCYSQWNKSKRGYVLTAGQAIDTTIDNTVYQVRFLKSERVKTGGFFSPSDDVANILIGASSDQGKIQRVYNSQTFSKAKVGDSIQGPYIGLVLFGEPIDPLQQPAMYTVEKVTGGNTEYLVDDTVGIVPIKP